MNNPTFKEVKQKLVKKIERLSQREKDCIKILWCRSKPIKGFNRYNEKITVNFD